MWKHKQYSNRRNDQAYQFWNPLSNELENLNEYLAPSGREEGISAYVRARNEEEFIALSIESHIDLVDEIIIVYNACTDATPEIISELYQKYPDKIKPYEYIPEVFPQGSKEFFDLPDNHPQSLINYYNFALAMTTKTIAFKLDCDQVAIQENFKKIARKMQENSWISCISFRGCNLYDTDDGEIFVNGHAPFTYPDRGFFRVRKNMYHVKNHFCEELIYKDRYFPSPKKCCDEILYFHLKSMKKDRGTSVWALDKNPDSPYYDSERYYHDNVLLLPFDDFSSHHVNALNCFDLNKLGIVSNKSKNQNHLKQIPIIPKPEKFNGYEFSHDTVSYLQNANYFTDPDTCKIVKVSELFNTQNRVAGVSGVLCVHEINDGIHLLFSSVLSAFDEIIVIYSGFDSALKLWVEDLKNKYGSKIIAYSYAANICTHSDINQSIPRWSVNNQANMNLFALSKTTKRYGVFLQIDYVFHTEFLKKVLSNVKRYGIHVRLTMQGLNVQVIDDSLKTNLESPFTNSECKIFPIDENFIPQEYSKFENSPSVNSVYVGLLYFHFRNSETQIDQESYKYLILEHIHSTCSSYDLIQKAIMYQKTFREDHCILEPKLQNSLFRVFNPYLKYKYVILRKIRSIPYLGDALSQLKHSFYKRVKM